MILDKLKEIAIKFQIDPSNTIGHAAKVETVIRVLADINKSYKNFLEIEFSKNNDFQKAASSNPKLLETIKEKLDLLLVDVNFGSFEAALAPNLDDNQVNLFKDEVIEWENQTFEAYRDLLVYSEYEDPKVMKMISDKYSSEERAKIFQPLFSAAGDGKDYRINLKDNNGQISKVLRTPEKVLRNIYVPKIKPEEGRDESDYKKIQAYMKVRQKDGKPYFTKNNIDEVLYYEEFEYDTYPFKPDIIKYDKYIFVLNSKLECKVEFEEEQYIISCEELDLIVWGSTREEAEEAFSFSFYSTYLNYYAEANERLHNDAIELKHKMLSLIKKVIDEA